MHTIERELIEATGYKAKGKFSNRQEYLKSIFNAVLKLSDDDFEALTDEAAAWANDAVAAHNTKEDDIPDFDETTGAADEDGDDAEPDEADAEADDEASEDEAEDDGDASEDEVPSDEPDPEDEDEPDEKPVKAKKAPAKVAAKKPEPKAVKAEAAPKAKAKPKQQQEDVVLDKWGCMEGSKNSQALNMFEKGATTKEVKDAMDGATFYNMLKKMVEKGHTLEKEGSMITLVHKDSKAAAKAPAKKAKK